MTTVEVSQMLEQLSRIADALEDIRSMLDPSTEWSIGDSLVTIADAQR